MSQNSSVDRERLYELGRKGAERYDAIKEKLENQYFGQFVQIIPLNGHFVVGETHAKVNDEFDRHYGSNTARFEEQIGMPIVVGSH